MDEKLVENVAQTMIGKVIDGKGELRDVYATCIKTLINDLPTNYSKVV